MIESGPLNFCREFQGFSFSDGQPHLKAVGGRSSRLLVRIASPADLFNVCQAVDVAPREMLRIVYLMGGRMDRRISADEPHTLKIVCDILNSLRVKRFEVIGAHSEATFNLLRDSFTDWQTMAKLQSALIGQSLQKITDQPDIGTALFNLNFSIVLPDAGALKWFEAHTANQVLGMFPSAEVVMLHKCREMRTGKITGHKLVDGQVLPNCVILDDLCDGGATFKSAAELLRKHGAQRVGLAVTHGIFSKGTKIDGIDHVSTTNSFCDRPASAGLSVLKVI